MLKKQNDKQKRASASATLYWFDADTSKPATGLWLMPVDKKPFWEIASPGSISKKCELSLPPGWQVVPSPAPDGPLVLAHPKLGKRVVKVADCVVRKSCIEAHYVDAEGRFTFSKIPYRIID